MINFWGDLPDITALKESLRCRCMNYVIRCLAKTDVVKAVEKAYEYLASGLPIESSTYTQLAAKSLTAGNFEMAEQLLEERDYL